MGGRSSSPVAPEAPSPAGGPLPDAKALKSSRAARKKSKKVDKDQQKEKKLDRKQVKLLLLGAGVSHHADFRTLHYVENLILWLRALE
jgi:hypothetical protein